MPRKWIFVKSCKLAVENLPMKKLQIFSGSLKKADKGLVRRDVSPCADNDDTKLMDFGDSAVWGDVVIYSISMTERAVKQIGATNHEPL